MSSATRIIRYVTRCAAVGATSFSLAFLSACTGSSDPNVAGSAASSNVGWTTLGSDTTNNVPETVLSSNADAKWVDYNPPMLYPKTTTTDTFITMPDGVRLAAKVVAPADALGRAITGSLPTVLSVTCYNIDLDSIAPKLGLLPILGGPDLYLIGHGYVNLIVDERGCGRSQGKWEAFSADEQGDFYNIVDWIVAQSWSDGKVAPFGASHVAINAVLAEASAHPAIKAAFPIAPMFDTYRDFVASGGNLGVGFIPLWMAALGAFSTLDPLIFLDPNGARTELQHIQDFATGFSVPLLTKAFTGDSEIIYNGDFWRPRSAGNTLANSKNFQVPTFVVGALRDVFQRAEPLMYESLKTRAPTKLLIGPWTHAQLCLGAGEPEWVQAGASSLVGGALPADGVPILDHIALQWFDHYLKGLDNGAEALPNVTQWVAGHDHFETSSDWPLVTAKADRLYLHGNMSLSPIAPSSGEAVNAVDQNVLAGLCSPSANQEVAGTLSFIGAFAPPLMNCSTFDNEVQKGELVYDSAVLADDYYINGPIEADIWMSSTAKKANVVVRVDDVDPATGKATSLTTQSNQAALRAVDPSKSRYLDGQMIQPWHPFTVDSVAPLTPGEPVMVPVELFPISALIKAGHQLRISVGTGDFPRALPPTLSELPDYQGRMSVYNDAAHPSSIVVARVPVSVLRR